jgi:hypothetical protein
MQREWKTLKEVMPKSGERVLVTDGVDVKLAVFSSKRFVSAEVMYKTFDYPYWTPIPKLPPAVNNDDVVAKEMPNAALNAASADING